MYPGTLKSFIFILLTVKINFTLIALVSTRFFFPLPHLNLDKELLTVYWPLCNCVQRTKHMLTSFNKHL